MTGCFARETARKPSLKARLDMVPGQGGLTWPNARD